MKSKKETCLLL